MATQDTMEALMREKLEQKLTSSGERERLRSLLQQRLSESGWQDEVKQMARDYINNKGSVQTLKAEEIINEITPDARRNVPDAIKTEMLERIREFVSQELDDAS